MKEERTKKEMFKARQTGKKTGKFRNAAKAWLLTTKKKSLTLNLTLHMFCIFYNKAARADLSSDDK